MQAGGLTRKISIYLRWRATDFRPARRFIRTFLSALLIASGAMAAAFVSSSNPAFAHVRGLR
ncbi:MAG: hypothetical protein BGN84_07815 [Afipia sp. 62-7]|nr:MAG: hypothetical protein BGN84_07815 [Afipia sp. 62-7]